MGRRTRGKGGKLDEVRSEVKTETANAIKMVSQPSARVKQLHSMRTELFWIDGPWPGRLAIMPRPRGGDWLEEEIQSWRRSGVDLVVSLLTLEERNEF